MDETRTRDLSVTNPTPLDYGALLAVAKAYESEMSTIEEH